MLNGGNIISRNYLIFCVLSMCVIFLSSGAIYAVDNNSSTPATSTMVISDTSGNNTTAHGAIWLREWDMDNVNLTQLKEAGVTDIFLHEHALEDPTYNTTVTTFLSQAQAEGIRVSIWLGTFYNNSKWIDPTGKYSYTVSVPYQGTVSVPYKYTYKAKVKVAYTKYVKKYYKSYYYNSYGKLKYKWKYTWVKKTYYTYKYKWVTVTKYKSVIKTLYKNETRYAYNMTYINNYKASLISKITKYAQTPGVGGIHLDYLRYPGSAYKSANGTASITNFVAQVDAALNAINPDILLSAALMPETNVNAYYYGQNYTQLAQYLDVLVPMVYEGNYNTNNTWITKTTSYIVNHSAGKPVWTGLQTYDSDNNIVALTAAQLLADVQSALDGGASGYALFRFGSGTLFDINFLNSTQNLTVPA